MIRRNVARTVFMEENQAVYDVSNDRNAANFCATSVAGIATLEGATSVSPCEEKLIDVGPAYTLQISEKGKFLAQNEAMDEPEAVIQSHTDASSSKNKSKHQEEWRIRQEITKMQRTDQNIRSHEQAHMSAAGAFAGSASYIYIKGPDGRMYASGGEVPIQAPEGKTPEDTVRNMEIVKRAALAPPDPSGQDLAVAAAAMQIENRARAAIQQGRFLSQSDMDEEKGASTLIKPAIMPTSMAGLIATLMPQQGMLGAGIHPN